MLDGRCRFGPRAKREMVARVLAGETARAIAGSMGCSPSTVTAARDRWRAASEAERVSGAWCAPRRPVPGSCPWALSAEAERAILDARAKSNWGPMRLTWLTGRHRSTIWKVLHRHGVSRQRRSQRPQTTRRYEWAEAGALLHIDAFELPKFDRPGHWAHGDRSQQHRTRQAGKVKVIGVIDDHTRLAYCELHGAETAQTVSATLIRAAAWMREQGCGPVQAVMSDNAKCYAESHLFAATLRALGARQILIPPRTPRWNGKIERFFRTLDTEWAHSRVWPHSTRRDRALASFMRFYNRRRPHSAASGRAPITRVQQVREQDS
jgi:transposase InsO family protein